MRRRDVLLQRGRTDDVVVQPPDPSTLRQRRQRQVGAPRLQAAAVALLHDGQVQVREYPVALLRGQAQNGLPNDLQRQHPELLGNLDGLPRAAHAVEFHTLQFSAQAGASGTVRMSKGMGQI